ncbi:hypothetical protein GCM10022380_66430 [Amycolatopsis tucumanensis]|uniref:Uncharacterized protein n=1 Tax=Amycolatopsis tucumanensis TaxID=401106 RepID=A0ABP7JBH8_9PSEU
MSDSGGAPGWAEAIAGAVGWRTASGTWQRFCVEVVPLGEVADQVLRRLADDLR